MILRPPASLAVPLACVALAAACARPAANERPAALPGGAYLVFTQADAAGTAFWAAPADAPARAVRLAAVKHDPEWGVRAALSPDGHRLAYTAMPPGARDPDGDAVLTLLDLDRRTSRRLASGVDLRTTPLWRADGGAVVVQRRLSSGPGALFEVEIRGVERRLLAAEPGHRLFPAGATEGGVLIVYVDIAGARLLSAQPNGHAAEIAPLAPGAARGFALSPDGRALAFLAIAGEGDAGRYRAFVTDLGSGGTTAIRPDVQREEDTGVAWTERGPAVTTVDGGRGVILLGDGPATTRPGPGFDAVVGASPDGRWLVVRSFAGRSTREPGPERLELVDVEGRRTPLGEDATAVIGWMVR